MCRSDGDRAVKGAVSVQGDSIGGWGMTGVRGFVGAVFVVGLVASCSKSGTTATPISVTGGGAEIVVPGGVDGSGLSIAAAGGRLHDPGLASVGKGYVAQPSGTTFAQPVTVRIPVSQAEMAGFLARPKDLAIYTRGEAEGRFHRLVTRVADGGTMLEADVQHFSSFQIGLATPDRCVSQGRPSDCTVAVCALADLIGMQDTMTNPNPSQYQGGLTPQGHAVLQAQTACDQAHDILWAEAIATLGQLETELVQDVASGAMTSGTYATLIGAIQDAEFTLLQVASVDVTGTWLASLPINGELRSITLQLFQRNDGSVMGYILGAPGSGALGRTVASGKVAANQFQLLIDDADGDSTVTFTVEGTVTPPTLETLDHPAVETLLQGTASDGTTTTAIAWHMTSASLVEKRFTFGGNGASGWLALSVVENEGTNAGGLVSGGFLSVGCGIVGCSGDVYGMTTGTNGALTFDLKKRDGTMARISASLQSDGTYTAAWTMPPDATTPSGDLTGFPTMGTTTAHAETMLRQFTLLANDLERHADFLGYVKLGSYPPLSSYYLHDGRNTTDLLAALATETHRFDTLEIRFNRFRNLATVRDPNWPPAGPLTAGVDFQDSRAGAVGTTEPTGYYNEDSAPPYDDLRHLVVVPDPGGDDIQIAGNQLFARNLTLPLADADVALAFLTPFGVHLAGAGGDGLGEDHFTLRIPVDTNSPSAPAPGVLAPTDLEVLFAAPEVSGQAACQVGHPAALVVSQTDLDNQGHHGVYVVVNSQMNCGWSALPTFFAAGDSANPMGTMAAEYGDQPGDDPLSHVVGFGLSLGIPGNLCPYWRLSDKARGQVIDLMNRSPYPEQLTEPLVCNPEQGHANPTNLNLLWTLQNEDVNQPVKAIRFIRPTLDASPMYQFTTTDAEGHETAPAPVWNFASAGSGVRFWVFTLGGDGSSSEPSASARVAVVPGGALLEIDFHSADLANPSIYTTGTPAAPCDDDNPCTDDTVIAFGLCTHDNNSNPCFAGDRCFLDDACADGACRHVPVDGDFLRKQCDEANGFTCLPSVGCVLLQPPDQCHVVTRCDPATGECSTAPKANGTPCDLDDSRCTPDTCQAGVCTPASAISCATDDPCRVDGTCDAATGTCGYQDATNGTACDDGDACTQTDACDAGQCVGANLMDCFPSDPCQGTGTCLAGVCLYPNPQTGPACDDQDPCTTSDHCVAGACTGAAMVCTANPCHDPGTCANGTCSAPTPKADPTGISCNDNVPFTGNDQCKADATCAGVAPDCTSTAPGGLVLAVDFISLGTSGHLQQGLDVDGKSATCSPTSDCADGVDNLVAFLSTPANAAILQELATVTWGTVLIDIFHDHGPDEDFVLPLYAGRLDPRNAGCRFTAPQSQACDFTLPYYDLDASCAPLYRFTNARISFDAGGTSGTLTAGGPGTAIPVTVPYQGQVLRGTVYGAQVSAHWTMDQDNHVTLVAPSIVAGAVRPGELVTVLDALFPGDDDIVLYQGPDPSFQVTKYVVRAMILGVAPDIDTDNDDVADAISIGARFTAREANVVGLAKPCATAADCDDSDSCTGDVCDGVVGCMHTFVTGSCDDGLPFTGDGQCDAHGACQPGAVPDCSAQVSFGPVAAVNTVRLGTSGTVGEGLNVDGNSNTCAPADFNPTCAAGIDDQAAIVSDLANSVLAQELATVTWGAVLLDFQHFVTRGAPFQLPLYGARVDARNASCKFTDQSCDFVVPYYNFDADCAPMYRFDNAVIGQTGLLTAGGPGHNVTLTVPYGGKVFRGTVYHAQVSAQVSFDQNGTPIGLADTSIVAGAIKPWDLWVAFDTLFPGPDAMVIHQDPLIDKGEVRYMLLTLLPKDVSSTGTGGFDAVSVGAVFGALGANVRGLAKACASATDCGDSDPCTDDHCDPVVGCMHSYNTASCTDPGECMTSGSCLAGFCAGTPVQNGTQCSIGTCQSGICTP